MKTNTLLSTTLVALVLGCVGLACSSSGDDSDPAAPGQSDDELRASKCSTVKCAGGTHCALQDVQCIKAPCPKIAACVPDECQTDSDCKAVDDYCTGCDCRALLSSQSLPACAGPGVRCFAAPCGGKTAKCVAKACVIK